MIAPKVFKVFEEEVIPKGSEYKWVDRKTREPKPSWRDLTDNRIAVPHYFLDYVLEYLEQKHFCIVVGDKDTGKTWLSYVSSHNFVKQGKEVRFATVDEDFDAEDAWNEIETQKLRGEGKPEKYFVAEDCHKNPMESEEFLQRILDEGEINLRFLFTMRKTGKILIEDEETMDTFYHEGTKQECIVRLLSNEMGTEHVKSIIKKFIEVKNIEYKLSERELEGIAKKWGNDLYWLWLRLNSWKYDEGQKLSNITDDQVYDSIWSDRYEIKLSLMNRRNILLPIAAVCQFEPLKMAESFLRWQDINEGVLKELKEEGMAESFLRRQDIDEGVLKELKEEGIIQISGKEYDFLSIKESFADIILSCVLRKDPFFKENYSTKESYTIQIIKNYLMQKPSNRGNVFFALNSARKAEKAISTKQILSSLLGDACVWGVIEENVKDVSLGQIISLLDSLLWIEGKELWMQSEKGQKIRSYYLRENYKNMQYKLGSSSARTIKRYLPLLARIVNLERFFSDFSISDYIRIINLSTINNIRNLFFDFQEKNWNIPSAIKGMAKALPEADLPRLIAQKNASLYRLGGLIGNIMQVDVSVATSFVEKLSEIDLSKLFSRKDAVAEKKGYTKAETINFFLSKWISFAPVHRKRIVQNINDEIWSHFIRSASSDQGFYLLWNIYVNDPIKAKRLVQNNTGEFLLHKCTEDQNVVFYLPLLGVLHLSDFAIHRIPLIGADITQIKQILMTFKKENKITLLVLSLVALKVKLPQEQFKDVKGILDEQLINFIHNNPDIQLRELLNNLIEHYWN